MNDKTGGAAFPGYDMRFGVGGRPEDKCEKCGYVPQSGISLGSFGGMTLRDYFAIHANEADVDCWINVFNESGVKIYPSRSRQAARYAFADSMLSERNKDQPPAPATTDQDRP